MKQITVIALLLIVSSALLGCGDGGISKEISSLPNNATRALSVPATVTASTWTFCAIEDGVCTFSGTRQVRYGVTGQYAFLTATASTPCNNQTFGDPAVGANKTCEYESLPADVVWTNCAIEDGVCNFVGTRQVRFGIPGQYAFATFTDSTPCTNQVFGDPAPGYDKTCSYSSSAPPVVTTQSQIGIENNKLGSTAWQLTNPAVNGEIEGYASATSVNKGSSIDLYVNSSTSTYNIDIYRMGYYGGKGARLLQSLSNISSIAQVKPCLNPNGVIECNWTVSRRIVIPDSTTDATSLSFWPSGIYLAKLTTVAAAPRDSYIIFAVRDDTRSATYVAQLPVTTYQAYNFWGGKSLYTGCLVHDVAWRCSDGTGPATSVSFNRPFGPSTNPQAQFGVGAGEFITNVQPVSEGYPISSAGFDYNMVRWMEAQGYDVKYITNIDLHEQPTVLANAKAFISTGHDEYYSRTMRDRLVTARDNGLNLAFYSSNQAYWQIRLGSGTYGNNLADRILTCYRNGGDPITDPMLRTGRYRDLGFPEAAFLGAQYVADPVIGAVTVTNPMHWLFTATGATLTTTLNGLLGYEVNAIEPGVSPPNVVTLAHSSSGGFLSDMTYYIAPSSGQVFGTGTMQWSWGLDNFVSNNLRADYTNLVAQNMTTNVFRAIAEQDLVTLKNATSALLMSTPPGNVMATQIVQVSSTGVIAKSNLWRLLSYGDGTFQIVSRANGLCLDSYGTTSGAIAGTYACHGLANQHWTLTDNGNNNVTIIDRRSQLCLAAQNGMVGSGLVMQTCTNSSAQLWQKQPL